MSILEDFISLIDSEETKVNIIDLFEDNDERLRWEKMVVAKSTASTKLSVPAADV